IGDDEEEITPEDTAASYGNVSAGGFGGMKPGGGMRPDGADGAISGNTVPGEHGGRGMHRMGQEIGSGDRPERGAMPGQPGADGEGMNAGPGTWIALIISAAGILAATGFACIYHRRRRI
ncbi:MAG: hypothetical protein K5847_05260, partial [Lachnospiraceae bacterium]|nr:hypothetical protein [Lachnospiraceae bacterium]